MSDRTPVVLGIDIGTTTIKAQVVSAAGHEVAACVSQPITMLVAEAGFAEQDPDDIWTRLVAVLREIGVGLEAASAQLVGVSMASQSGSVLAMGADDRPIGNLITWMDTRSKYVVDRWRQGGEDDQIRARSGWSVAPGLGLPIIVWLREQRPDLWRAARRFVGLDSFIAHGLTGIWMTNPSNAAGMQLLDVASGEWSDELLELADIGIDQLPGLARTGSQLGWITEEGSASTGLPEGTPVINGGHDQACSALALGVVEPSDVLVAGGTAWVLTAAVGAPDRVSSGFNVSRHVVDGRWTASRFLGGYGGALAALLDEAYPAVQGEDRASRYRRLDTEVAGTEPTTEGLFFRVNAAGADPLHGAVGRARTVRTLMEAAAIETELALHDLGGTVGRPSRITLLGGVAASPIWPQVIADTTGTPIDIGGQQGWPARGAASIAASALGLRQEQKGPAVGGRAFEPDPGLEEHYRRRIVAYEDARH